MLMPYALNGGGSKTPDEPRHYKESQRWPYPQMYETLIIPSEELAWHVVTIPRRYRRADPPTEVASQLGLHRFGDISRADFAVVVASYLTAVADREELLFAGRIEYIVRAPAYSDEWLEVAENLLTIPYIPIEQSPLVKASLSSLIIEAADVATMAWVGFAVPAKSSSAVLLVILPASIIIMRAVRGVAAGLERGLKERVYKWVAPEPIPRQLSTRQPAKRKIRARIAASRGNRKRKPAKRE